MRRANPGERSGRQLGELLVRGLASRVRQVDRIGHVALRIRSGRHAVDFARLERRQARLLFRACFDGGPAAEPGVYVTETAGSYRTFVTAGFGPDWNPRPAAP